MEAPADISNRLPLFRQESLDARREAWAASSHLPKNASLRTAAWVSIFVSLSLLIFLVFGEYTRRVRAEGVILPSGGLSRIAAPANGWIREANVREGDAVKQGEVLYCLDVDSITERGGTQKATIGLLRQLRDEIIAEIDRHETLSQGEKQQLLDDLEYSREELQQIEAHHALLTEFADTLEKNTNRQEDLVARGFSTFAQMESRQQVHMSYRLRLETLLRERLQLVARIAQLTRQVEMVDQKFASSLGELRQRLIEIDRQISEGEARREIRVVAPRDGRVTAVMADAGQVVISGSPMLTIIPEDAHLQGQLLVPSGAIGFINAGDRVLMRYESFPYQRFGQFSGTIVAISRTTLRPEELDQLVVGGSARRFVGAFYRVTIEPDHDEILSDGQRERLQPGMQFEAHILAESRRLYQWLLSPLYRIADGFTGSRDG